MFSSVPVWVELPLVLIYRSNKKRTYFCHILQTLLDGCCSGPILLLGEDGQFRLDTESVAVVQDLRLLSEILLDWKVWAKAQVDE